MSRRLDAVVAVSTWTRSSGWNSPPSEPGSLQCPSCRATLKNIAESGRWQLLSCAGCGRQFRPVQGALHQIGRPTKKPEAPKLPELPKASRGLSMADKHEIRRYREAGASIERLALMWGVTKRRISQILAEMRERLGMEELPPEKRPRARAHLFKRSPGTDGRAPAAGTRNTEEAMP